MIKKSKKIKEVRQYAYVGPTILKPLHLSQYQVVKDPASKELNAFMKDKQLKNLFVDVKDLSKAISEIEDPKSVRSQLVKRASKKIKEMANEL